MNATDEQPHRLYTLYVSFLYVVLTKNEGETKLTSDHLKKWIVPQSIKKEKPPTGWTTRLGSTSATPFLPSFLLLVPTDLKIAPTADNVGHPRVLVGPAEHGPLPGHRVQRSPHALWVLAAPAHHVDHARRFVPAAPRAVDGGRGGGGGRSTLRCSSWFVFSKWR